MQPSKGVATVLGGLQPFGGCAAVKRVCKLLGGGGVAAICGVCKLLGALQLFRGGCNRLRGLQSLGGGCNHLKVF